MNFSLGCRLFFYDPVFFFQLLAEIGTGISSNGVFVWLEGLNE